MYCNSICALQSVWPDVHLRYIGGVEHGSCKASFVGSWIEPVFACVWAIWFLAWSGENAAFLFNWNLSMDPINSWRFTPYLLSCRDAPLKVTWPGRALHSKHVSYPDTSLRCGCGPCHLNCAAQCARTTDTLTEVNKPSWQKPGVPAGVFSVCCVGWRLPFSVSLSGKTCGINLFIED